MSATPIRLWSLKVPATGEIVALEELGIPLNVSITMAAIDPTEEVKGDGPKLATLKILHQNMTEPDIDDFDDDESIDSDLASGEDVDSEDDSEEEEKPKGKGAAKAKDSVKVVGKKAAKDAEEEDSEDSDDGDDLMLEGSDDDDDDYEEVVICTLDPTKAYQQPLQLTVGDGEPVFFKANGAYTIYLTGNYVTEPRQGPPPSGDSDEEDDEYSEDDEEGEFDLDNEQELQELLERIKSGAYGGDEDSDDSDELDDVEDPRITEIDDEEEAPALVKAKKPEEALTNKEKKAAAKAAQLKAKAAETAVKALSAKDTKKRSADEMDVDTNISSETLSNGTTVSTATVTASVTETPPSSLSKKQQKKLKANSGEPVAVATPPEKKKVQFASQLEQGPTPNGNKSPADKSKAEKEEKPATQSSKVRTVDGVKIEDHKVGSGPEAKKGKKVSMRYIGKLTDGKVFDSNKKGKPFTFNLGKGDVIKGWDIGVAGMKVGGERKLVIPPNLAYGSKALPGIPKNSTLVFEVKLLEVK
ncbi:hypothetical protein ABW20_dc0107238 [Dactylellina cionopaga]|nr:hypothetical protein ABW20_dc0107238 [Dactylellina cionopaga]